MKEFFLYFAGKKTSPTTSKISKMAANASDSKCSITLPREMWLHVWGFLDFDTLQKKCTTVSKQWLKEIRNSSRLSGVMGLKNLKQDDFRRKILGSPQISEILASNQDVKRINEILSRWKKLKVLHMSTGTIPFGINLKKHKLLRKIVLSKSNLTLKKLGDWGKVTKHWFDPKLFWTPAKLENVIRLKVKMEKMPKDLVRNEKIGKGLKNVEKLTVTGHGFNPQLALSFKLKKLKTLVVKVDRCDINGLLSILHATENVKNLDLGVFITIGSSYDLDGIKAVFNQALEIIDKKFPRHSTKFEINDYSGFEYNIKKYRGQAPKLIAPDESEPEQSVDSDDNANMYWSGPGHF
jgi:hypothetical protein